MLQGLGGLSGSGLAGGEDVAVGDFVVFDHLEDDDDGFAGREIVDEAFRGEAGL